MKKYTLLFHLLLFAVVVHGQPVRVLVDSTYNYRTTGGNSQDTPIDIDNDGDTDFTFQYLKDNVVIIAHIGSYSSNSEVLRTGSNIQVVSIDQRINRFTPGSYDRSDVINPSDMFEGFRLVFGFCNGFGCNTNGNFTEANNSYVAVRFRQDESAEWQYGYIGISASVANGVDAAFVTINSIGYEQTPGQRILAGAGILSNSLNPEAPESVSVFPNPTAGILNVDPNLNLVNVSVFNGLGQLVIQGNRNENQLDLSFLPGGNYYLRATDKEGLIYLQRIVKQ